MGFKAITRRMALSIAERCELKELQPEILNVVLDRSEHPVVRAGAVAALRRCGDASIPAQIVALLDSDLGPDPDSEIRGYALDLFWPRHINATDLFSFIVPSNDQFYGAFESFLFELPATLTNHDFLPALAWATAYIVRADQMYEFREKTLADAIMFRAWEVFDQPGVTDPFLAHIAARLQGCGELYLGTNYKAKKAFAERLRNDTSRRQQFILQLCTKHINLLDAYSYCRAGFVRDEDFAWLFQVSPASGAPVIGLNDATLCYFVERLFRIGDNAQFEMLYPALDRWPLLRTKFGFLVDGVPLDGEDASRARDLKEQMRKLSENQPPSVVVDTKSEISRLLAQAEGGECQAWWMLNLALMLTPESRRIRDELNYFITSMPGWVAADDEIRRRITVAARRYLTDADTSVKLWLGQNPTPIYRDDIAALRAFILLRQASPDVYSHLPPAAWEKWAPTIMGTPSERRHGSSQRN